MRQAALFKNLAFKKSQGVLQGLSQSTKTYKNTLPSAALRKPR